MNNLRDLKSFSKNIKEKFFDYDLKNTNWFNIGGTTEVYYKPESLNELVSFLKLFGSKEKIFVLGAGSNVLFSDNVFRGIIIKLGKNFSNISLLSDNKLVAGSATIDKKLSEFACKNNIGGFEFLSCIPGTIGGGLKMNSGCFDREFKDIILSIQAINKKGQIFTIPASKIKFIYRGNDLDNDLIFLSASFKGKFKDQELIQKNINFLKNKKDKSQPSKIKTGGSTFKNPKDQTQKIVWALISKSVPMDTKFGGAEISQKHCNFFVNKNNATFNDMKNLINFVKQEVKSKTGINIETEIEIVE